MKLTYHLKKWDILLGRISFMFTNKVLLIVSILVICLMTLSLSTGDSLKDISPYFRVFWTVFAFFLSVGLYRGGQLALLAIMTICSKQVGVLGDHTLEIMEDGLEESTTFNRSLHRWNPTFRVKQFAGYIWIYPTDGRVFQIPTRPRGHEGDLATFIAHLKAKIAGNQQ